MSILIEIDSRNLLVPSAIRRFSIEPAGKKYEVRVHLIGEEEHHILATCRSEKWARQCIEKLWADAHKESKAVTIKAKIEEV
mgnify:CR=1 FL=1